MSRTKCGPLHDLCRPHQNIWHKQSWWALKNYGKVWLFSQVHSAMISNGAAIPWWHACTGRIIWADSCNNWSQTRLCTTGTGTVQHDSMMFSTMLTDAFQYWDDRFPIRYRFDGKLFNLRMLQAKANVHTGMLDELLYADDMAKNASTERKMRNEV